MTSIKVRNPDGSYSVVSTVGPPGPAGPLDILTDVSAPANTPVSKVLGTTAIGVWGPVDAFWKGTQAAYDAIAIKDPNVLYVITA